MRHIVCPNCLAFEISDDVMEGLTEGKLFAERARLSKMASWASEAGRPLRLMEMDDIVIALSALDPGEAASN